MTQFTPSPQLFMATKTALNCFARHKPHMFKTFRAGGQEADVLVSEWARALVNITLEAITEAAAQWVATKPDVPYPATFAQFARRLDFDQFRGGMQVLRSQPDMSRHQSQLNTIGKRVFAALGSSDAIAEVSAELWRQASTDEERQRVREGHVELATLDAVIEVVRRRRQEASDKTAAVVAGVRQ